MTDVIRSERSLTIVRTLRAPREAVFRAWTDPEQLHWFANLPPLTPTTVDLRVGGAWRLHMVESADREYMTGGVYREIVPPERLVFAWGAVDGWPRLDPTDLDKGPIATLRLSETDGVTEMTFTVDFPDTISDDDVRGWFAKGIADGWRVTIDRLLPHLDATVVRADTAATTKPLIVSAGIWQLARDELLKAEKEATRALDTIAARRRRLPMVKFDNDYLFDTPTGAQTLLDLFDGRDQLAVYQFMDRGPDQYCPGCTWFTNNVPATGLAGLNANGVSWATVSDMPLAQIEAHKQRNGWTLPFVSSHGTSWSADCGVSDGFMLSVFLRDGNDVYRTYNTSMRGVDRLVFTNSLLDLMPYGRQEDWEDSPPGWPKQPS